MPTINMKRFSRSNVEQSQPLPSVEQSQPIQSNQPIQNDPEIEDYDADDDNDDDFLADLGNDVFVSEIEQQKKEKETEKEQKKREAEERKYERMLNKEAKMKKDAEKEEQKLAKQMKKDEEDQLFSEKGSQLYGRDKLQLIAKIQQYKILFPDNKQLKLLKVKRNASVEELQQYVAECESIVDTDVVETFMTDSILQVLKMAEFASVRTRFNIKGLADVLKQNPQFNMLCKQLYIKYKVFSNVPPEAQLLLLVTSTAYVVAEKNRMDAEKGNVLQKQVDPTMFL